MKYAQNAYQRHICAHPKRCRIDISFSGEHSVHIFEKCAWNTHQTMNSRFLHFCATNECASGTRLVHVCDISRFSQKPAYSKHGLKPSPEPHFLFAHAIAAFGMLLWLLTFCKTLTLALWFCSDCLTIPCETHKNAYVFNEILSY